MTITLADLNSLRVINGKTSLKSWKESKAKLAAAIDKEQGLMAANVMNPKGNPEKARTVKRQHGEVATPKAIKSVKVAAVNVAQIAKELGINPKVARAKLRKLNINRADAAAIRKALTK